MTVRWTPRALRDLREIGAFISQDSPDAARRWVERLVVRGEQIPEAPLSGRVVPEYNREDLREVILNGYRIVYLLGADEIDIVAVLEGHRRFPPGRVKR